MLNRVAVSVNFSVRQVVLRHPNSIDCAVYRKQVIRTEQIDGQDSEFAGSPTLGGAGVLNSEDEAEFDYIERGDARMRMIGTYEPSDINDRGDAELQATQGEAQIVSLAAPEEDGFFIPEKNDIVIAFLGAGIAVAYEVVQPIGSISIQPYPVRFLLNPRDDLNYIEPFKSLPGEAPPEDGPVDANTPTN
ncbi:hypothetical protein [Nevskia ramosa]|uniref:hypothetical protein n=1 Tax=Nevskia ramosa TaxID=64002 RepID=UPI003D10004A